MKFPLNNRPSQASRAFTLIDVMVSMGILGIVLVSLFGSFTFGFNVVKLTREELQATQLLQQQLESIRLYNWDKATTNNSTFTSPLRANGPIFFAGSISNSIPIFTNDVKYSNDLRRVTVSVTWTNNNVKYSRSTSTFVSRYGLFKYTLN